MTIYCGIDPGVNGAFAIIDIDGGRIYGTPMPTFWRVLKSGKRRKQYDYIAIRKFLEVHKGAEVTIEEQFPMPMIFKKANGVEQRQGATSVFSTGYGFGVLMGILSCLDLKTQLVHPKTWQAAFFKREEGKTTKEQALEVVKELYPDVNLYSSERSTVPHTGIVDAILLAEYGRRSRGDK